VYAELEGGYSAGFHTFQSVGALREFQMEQRSGHLMGSLESSYGYVRAFWNSLVADSGQTAVDPLRNFFNSDTFDVEAAFQRQFHLVVDHNLSIGAGYRMKLIEWDFLDGEHQQNHFNGFIQDTLSIG